MKENRLVFIIMLVVVLVVGCAPSGSRPFPCREYELSLREGDYFNPCSSCGCDLKLVEDSDMYTKWEVSFYTFGAYVIRTYVLVDRKTNKIVSVWRSK